MKKEIIRTILDFLDKKIEKLVEENTILYHWVGFNSQGEFTSDYKKWLKNHYKITKLQKIQIKISNLGDIL